MSLEASLTPYSLKSESQSFQNEKWSESKELNRSSPRLSFPSFPLELTSALACLSRFGEDVHIQAIKTEVSLRV